MIPDILFFIVVLIGAITLGVFSLAQITGDRVVSYTNSKYLYLSFLSTLFLLVLFAVCYCNDEGVIEHYKVTMVANVAVINVDGHLVNLNRESDMNFTDGQIVPIRIYKAGNPMIFGLVFRSDSILRVDLTADKNLGKM